MFENLWWVYVAIGILLIALEIFTPNFIVMWFGIASIITALPVYLEASTNVIIFTYALSLLVLTTFIRKITMDWFMKGETETPTNINAIIGKKGIVTEEIDLIKGSGRVKVGKEVWSAICDSGENITENTQIVVVKPDGAKLIVKKES